MRPMRAAKHIPRIVSRSVDIAPHLLKHPAHLYGGLRGVNLSALERLDRPWIRDIAFDTILDVGANTGQFASASHFIWPRAAICSFEPLPDCVDKLRNRMRSVPQFKVFATAIGNEDGTVTIHRSAFSPSSSVLEMTDEHTAAFPWTTGTSDTEVDIRKLDGFLPQLDLAGNVLLKVDVQGFEREVLLGAGETLRTCVVVLVETSFAKLYEGESTFDEIHEFMRASGFMFGGFLGQLEHPRTGRILQGDAVFQPVSRT